MTGSYRAVRNHPRNVVLLIKVIPPCDASREGRLGASHGSKVEAYLTLTVTLAKTLGIKGAC
jgi:hypothetical protein